ncbi:MAG: tetratricopeptide repeat protein [Oscillochloris sp.]|nr:tetratricopeptide repeat protein [Oscillochloris sp.]
MADTLHSLRDRLFKIERRRGQNGWDADEWEAILANIVQAEAARDTRLKEKTWYQHEPKVEELAQQTRQDTDWYDRMLHQIEPAGWFSSAQENRDRERHCLILAQRLAERRLRLAEHHVSLLEHKRRARKRVADQDWQAALHAVEEAWERQEAAVRALDNQRNSLNTSLQAQLVPGLQELRQHHVNWLDTLLANPTAGSLGQDQPRIQAYRNRISPRKRSDTGSGAAFVLLFLLIMAAVAGAGASANNARHMPPTLSQSANPPPPVIEPPTALPLQVGAKEAIDAGRNLMVNGEYAAAAAKFSQALVSDPAFYEAHTLLALCAFEQGNSVEALALIEQALSGNPLDAEALAARAAILFSQGQVDAALRDFQTALDLDLRYRNAVFLQGERGWGSATMAAWQGLWHAAGA